MVEWKTDYHMPMDRQYHGVYSDVSPSAHIEEPIFTIGELGQTVPEQDPAGRLNIIQNVQAAIRHGAGVIQMVLNVPPESPLGGRPKAYGKEVREAIREVVMANDVLFAGVELPTAISNLSGFDPQRGVISEEKRARDIDEVRDAIKFTADVAQGGGVDVFTADVPRNFFEANWNKTGRWAGAFKEPEEEKKGVIRFVDDRTGEIQQLRLGQGVWRAADPKTGEEFKPDPTTGRIQLEQWRWEDFKRHAPKEGLTSHEFFKKSFLLDRLKIAQAQAEEHFFNSKVMAQRVAEAEAEGDQAEADLYRSREKSEYNAFVAKSREVKDNEEAIAHLKPLEEYGAQRAKEGFAQAGIYAWEETHNNPRKLKRPVYVGPEIGWPQGYGGHPDEFVGLIRGARKIMAEKLHYDQGMPIEQAKEQAKIHVKGLWDSSHMGMWLEKFKPELPWHQRVKEFNKWYLEKVKELAKINEKEQIIGGMQLVNSATAAHGHLPPGQGIFPVIDAANIFKKHGFTGFVVSEGHEEERLGEGRILMDTWRSFGAPIQTTYGPGAEHRRFGVDPGYISRSYSPTMMMGSYAPPFGEYKPWNEIPFE